MKPKFSPQIITELRTRLVQHNRAMADQPAFQVNLRMAKRLYQTWFGGKPDPVMATLAKIDAHLADQRSAAVLAKASQPRRPNGEFASTGGSGAGGGGERGGGGREDPPPSSPSDDLLTAAQTQVIPETRYEVFGPPIAGAAGIAAGAAVGATAKHSGSVVDRAVTAGLGAIGGAAGGRVGGGLSSLSIGVTRAATGAVNRIYGTRLPMPGPISGSAAVARARRAGAVVGSAIGAAAGHGSAAIANWPSATARVLTQRALGGGFRAHIAGRGAGALVGALIPGAYLFAPALQHGAQQVGPYIDTLFPRRVRKADGSDVTDEEVLAKAAEIIGADDLAKVSGAAVRNIVASGWRYLAPPAAAASRRIVAAIRPSVASLRSRFSSAVPSPSPIGVPPSGPASQFGPPAAATAFAGGEGAALRPRRIGRALTIVAQAIPITALGSGLGAALGFGTQAALERFTQLHPRDKRGRWTHKGAAAVEGARIGAVAGLGLSLVSGVIAARHGRAALLRQALTNLGSHAVEMRTHAATAARTAHAVDFASKNRKALPAFAPNATINSVTVRNSLAAHATRAWEETVGRAIRGGPVAWYQHQLDGAFDREAGRQLRLLGEPGAKGGIRGKFGEPVTGNLIDDIDPERLNPAQRKLWDGGADATDEQVRGSLVGRHRAVMERIGRVFEERKVEARVKSGKLQVLRDEEAKLKRNVAYIPERAGDLDVPGSKLAEIKSFAEQHLGHKIQATTRVAALDELVNAVRDWEAGANRRLHDLPQEIRDAEADMNDVRVDAGKDLADAERMAIRNPFAPGARKPYFDALPDYAAAKELVGRRATRQFVEESDRHADAAASHLDALVATQQAAINARLPQAGAFSQVMRRAAPQLAARLHQANADYNELLTARRAELTGMPRAVSDFIQQHKDPKRAWQTAKNLGARSAAQAANVNRQVWGNWRTISTLAGLATTVGAVDLSAPGGPRFTLNPRKWKTPKSIKAVHEWPDAVGRPNEAVIGLSYRNHEGQEVFLHGVHVRNANGDRTAIPFGANVQQVMGKIRGGGQQNTKAAAAEPIPVKNAKGVQDKIDQLRGQNRIAKAGPPEAEFLERTGGDPEGFEREVADGFYEKHLKFLEQYMGKSTIKPERYWSSLTSLFDAPGSELMDRKTRVSLLIGGNGRKRGIFANAGDVLKAGGDKAKIRQELIRQIATFAPTDDDQYRAMRRATGIVGEQLGLSDADQADVKDALDKAFTKASSKEPPGAETFRPTAAADTTAGSDEASKHLEDELVDAFPTDMRRGSRADIRSDADFRTTIRSLYRRGVEAARRTNPTASEDVLHAAAARVVKQKIGEQINLTASEPMGDLAKFLARQPAIDGSAAADGAWAAPKVPGISGARSRAAPTVAPIAGAARPPSAGGTTGNYLRGEAQPARALSQAGSYGLGQAGYAAAHMLGQTYFPGGGVIGGIARFGAEAIGGLAGGIGGQVGGERLGRKIGGGAAAPMDTKESLIRSSAGTVAQVAGVAASKKIVGRIGGAAGKAVGQGIAQRVGGAIGGDIGEGVGAAAGTVAEPGGGTVAGGAGGFLAGQAIGAGLGWLADEGVGLLYHHLSRYGAQVPHIAAKSLGVPPAKRAAAATFNPVVHSARATVAARMPRA